MYMKNCVCVFGILQPKNITCVVFGASAEARRGQNYSTDFVIIIIRSILSFTTFIAHI